MQSFTSKQNMVRKQIARVLYDYLPLIKNVVIYACGSLVLRSISLLTAPLTMSMLTPSDYGSLALINSFISVMCIVGGLGLRQAVSLEYFHGDELSKKKLIARTITTYCTITPAFVVVLLLLKPYLETHLFGCAMPASVLYTSGLVIVGYFFSELIYQLLQYQEQALRLTLLQTGCALITVLCTITFLYGCKLGAFSIILSQLIGIMLVCGLGIWYCAKKDIIPLQKPTWLAIKESCRAGLPFLPSMFFAWLLSAGDRFVLARYASLHDVGIYAVADTFGQLFQLVVLIPFSNAYLPHLMKQFSAHATTITTVERSNKLLLMMLVPTLFVLMSIGLFLVRPVVAWWLPPAYHEALLYVWLLLTGYLLLVASYFPAALIQFKKKTMFLAGALCIPAVANIGLNILLVPHYKIMGCVLATVCAYALYFVIVLMYNKHLCRTIAREETVATPADSL